MWSASLQCLEHSGCLINVCWICILGYSRHSLNIDSKTPWAIFLLIAWISLAFCELTFPELQFRYFFFFFWPHNLQDLCSLTRHWTSGIWQWKFQVLTTGRPGSSQNFSLGITVWVCGKDFCEDFFALSGTKRYDCGFLPLNSTSQDQIPE